MVVHRDGMNFGDAFKELSRHDKEYGITRSGWYGTDARPVVKIQRPDANSFMTEPYLYMEKYRADGKVMRFPVTLSCEAQMAEDWRLVTES